MSDDFEFHIPEELIAEAKKAVANNPRPKIPQPWPKPLAPEALIGVAGEFLQAVEPHTEGDPAALLIQFLVAFGNAISRTCHMRVSADRHYTNIFMNLVGETAEGRKGTSWNVTRDVMQQADPEWSKCVTVGLSSGEGLIWAVRDPIEEQEPIRDGKSKHVTGYQTVVTDEGVADKRLLVVESEFASVLRVAGREGNTLSPVIRQAWDGGELRTMTKNSPAVSTGAHVSIIGHITPVELGKSLTSTEAGNGLANRFLWVSTRRSKFLPEGGELSTVDFAPIIRKIRRALEHARRSGEVFRDSDTKEMWADVYKSLSTRPPGLLGSVTSRSAPQVLRLSLIYAMLDCSSVIRMEHLAAALEVWRYCEDSAKHIFGDAVGDSDADLILAALRNAPQGMTKTQISKDVFKKNRRADEIARALNALVILKLAIVETRKTEGRDVEIWHSVDLSEPFPRQLM